MTVVVTGATGQLGSLIIAGLTARGVGDIVATGRRAAALEPLAADGVRTVRSDYELPASLDAAFAGADTLVFVSGDAPGSRLGQHTNVVRAAQRAGVGRIVYTSIVRADSYDGVLTPDHRATEQLIAETGIPFAFLRNTLYSEVFLSYVLEAAQTNEVVARWGTGAVASASRGDLAEGAAAVVAAGSTGVFELTGGVAWDGRGLAAAAGDLLGKPVTYAPRTADEERNDLAVEDVAHDAAEFRIALDGDIEAGAFGRVESTLTGLLGRPTVPLADALRAVLPPGVGAVSA